MSQSTFSTQDEQFAAAALTLQATDTTPPDVPGGPGYIIIDGATDDEGAKQGEVLNNGITDDLTPILHGHVEHARNSDLMIYANTQLLGIVKTDDNGYWSFTPQLLDHSQYTFEVLLKDPGGSMILTSMPFTITTTDSNHDYQTPVITGAVNDNGSSPVDLTNGESTNDTTPVLKGTADANQTVYIYDGNDQVATVVADANGVWTFTPPAALDDGVHIFSATEMGDATETDHSNSFVVVVDTQASLTITGMYDDRGYYTGLIPDGGKTDDYTPTLKGTADPHSIVYITTTDPAGQVYHNSVTAGSDGNWSWDSPDAVLGMYHYSVQATDPAGNQSDMLTYSAEKVDDNQDNNYTSKVIVSDTLFMPMTNNQYTGEGFTITANKDIVLTNRGPTAWAGVHEKENSSKDNYMQFNLEHPTTDISFTISGLQNDNGGSRVVITDTNGNIIYDQNVLADGDKNDLVGGNEHRFSFDAPAGTTIANVRVYNDVSGHGGIVLNDLSYSYDKPYDPATSPAKETIHHHTEALQFIGKDNVYYLNNVDNITSNVTYTHTAGDTTAFSGLWIDNSSSADNYFLFRFGHQVKDIDFRISGLENNQGGSRVVITDTEGKVIYDQYVKADGSSSVKNGHYHNFSFTAPEGESIANVKVYGDHTQGNGTAGGAIILDHLHYSWVEPTLDTPNDIVLTDNVGLVTGPIENGGITNDPTPVLSGKALPASTIMVYDKGVFIGSTVTSGEGEWTYKLPTALPDGDHTITTKAVNTTTGEFSPYTDAFTFTEETQPYISGIYNHGTLLANGSTLTTDDPGALDFNIVGKPNGSFILMMYRPDGVIGGYASMDLDSNGHATVHLKDYMAEGGKGTYIYAVRASEVERGPDYVINYKEASDNPNANYKLGASDAALHDHIMDMSQIATSVHLVNLADSQHTALQLSHDDILSHAQQNMFINDGKQQLAIQGDKGDVVELKGEDLAANTWTDTGHSTVAGVTYEVYQHTGDNLELLVQQGVELQHS